MVSRYYRFPFLTLIKAGEATILEWNHFCLSSWWWEVQYRAHITLTERWEVNLLAPTARQNSGLTSKYTSITV